MLLIDGILGAGMGNHERRTAYTTLWVFALAFGGIEASAVVYVREIYVRAVSLLETSYFAGFPVTLVSLPSRLVVLEMAREGCTIVLLGAVAWLAGRRPADRAGAFFLSFGIWDLTYYAALQLVLGWPDSLSAWDILFLIPLPWVAPVWAPVRWPRSSSLQVATCFGRRSVNDATAGSFIRAGFKTDVVRGFSRARAGLKARTAGFETSSREFMDRRTETNKATIALTGFGADASGPRRQPHGGSRK